MENTEVDLSAARPPLPPPHERLIAALAHLSAFVPGFGWLMAFTFWFASRGEARYAAYQAKQAGVFQIFMGFICAVSWFSSAILAYNVSPGPFYGLIGTIVRAYWLFIPLFMLLVFTISYSFIAAIYCAWGLPFRYRFISLWLRPE